MRKLLGLNRKKRNKFQIFKKKKKRVAACSSS